MEDDGYPLITAQNAAAAVERNALKRGRGEEKYSFSPIYSQSISNCEAGDEHDPYYIQR